MGGMISSGGGGMSGGSSGPAQSTGGSVAAGGFNASGYQGNHGSAPSGLQAYVPVATGMVVGIGIGFMLAGRKRRR